MSARPAYDEKKLAASLQKLGISSVPGIEEATLMTNDGELLSFSNAKVSASVQANTCVISGNVTVTQVDKPAAAAEKAEDAEEEEIVAEEEAKPKAEEKDDSDTDDDMPDLDEAAEGNPDGKGHKQTKHEKKVRKALSGIGLKDAAGFSQMAVRNGKSMMLIIKNPDVMKVTSGKGGATYAVFGKVEVEDANAKQQQAQQLMEQIRAMQEKQGAKEGEDDSDDECPDLAEVTFGEEEKAEIGDLSEDDVKLVIDQAGVTRNKAISALKENDGDVVNAIMSLSDS